MAVSRSKARQILSTLLWRISPKRCRETDRLACVTYLHRRVLQSWIYNLLLGTCFPTRNLSRNLWGRVHGGIKPFSKITYTQGAISPSQRRPPSLHPQKSKLGSCSISQIREACHCDSIILSGRDGGAVEREASSDFAGECREGCVDRCKGRSTQIRLVKWFRTS